MRRSVITAVAWLGCGSPAAPATPPPVVSVAAPPARAQRPLAPEAPPAAITDKLELGEAACSVETSWIGWRFELWPRLCDEALTHCVLELNPSQAEDMRVSPVIGKRAKAFVEIRYRGLEVRGFVDLMPVAVYPTKELRLNGFFRPSHLHIGEAKAGRLVLIADPGPALKPVEPLRVEVGCDEISWRHELYRNLEDLEPMLGATTKQEYVQLGPGRVAFALTPGGKPVATLEAEEPYSAYAYQNKGRDRFVITWTDGGYLFGWVRGVKRPPADATVGHGSSGRSRAFVPTPTPWTGLRCAADVPILVRSGERLFEAGRVLAGKVFSVKGEIEPGLVELELHHQRYTDGGSPPDFQVTENLRPYDGAKLAVESRLLRDCARNVPGEPESPPRRR